MLTGQLPWSCGHDQKMIDQICRAEYYLPSYLSDPCRDLISKILEKDPKKRLSTEQMAAHPWLAAVLLPSGLSESAEGVKGARSQPVCLIPAERSIGLSGTALMLIRKGRLTRANRSPQQGAVSSARCDPPCGDDLLL
jgi:serine/threonine protein kinase